MNKDLDIRKEDVFIGLVDVAKENWSFGNGEAQYFQKIKLLYGIYLLTHQALAMEKLMAIPLFDLFTGKEDFEIFFLLIKIWKK